MPAPEQTVLADALAGAGLFQDCSVPEKEPSAAQTARRGLAGNAETPLTKAPETPAEARVPAVAAKTTITKTEASLKEAPSASPEPTTEATAAPAKATFGQTETKPCS